MIAGRVGAVIGAALVAAGFIAIGLAWAGASGIDDVQSQFAYLVSGGLGGLALIVFGATLVAIDRARRDARAELDLTEDLLAVAEGAVTETS